MFYANLKLKYIKSQNNYVRIYVHLLFFKPGLWENVRYDFGIKLKLKLILPFSRPVTYAKAKFQLKNYAKLLF